MKYHKGIQTKPSDSANFPWEVYVPKAIFGKMIRRKFKTKEQALAYERQMKNKELNKHRAPLDPDIHKVISGYQHLFEADELRAVLEKAVAAKELGNGTIGDFGDAYLAFKEDALELGAVSKKFVDDIRVRLPRAKAFFKDIPAREITPEMITKYAIHLKRKGLAPTTIKNYVKKELGAIFHYGINRGQLTHNPAKHATIAAEKPKIGILTPPQLQQLLNAADHYIQAFLMFGAYAGLRSSEISLIRWEDIDLESNEIYVPGKKNVCAERYVTLTEPLKDYCQKMLKGDNPPEGLVMAGLKNTSISQRRKKAIDETGIKIPRNALRHSYASHHLKHFGNGRKTAHEMGHATETMAFTAYRRAVSKDQAMIYWTARIGEPLPQEPTQAQERQAEAA